MAVKTNTELLPPPARKRPPPFSKICPLISLKFQMDRLPLEIWEEIVRTHLHTKDYLTLSTTTALFCAIAQKALFEEVYLFRNLEEEDNHPDNCELALFAASLADRPDLGALVSFLHINSESDNDDDEEKLDRYSLHPILSNLSLFPRLRRLRLAGFRIDADFCSAVRSHPRLTTIEFAFCSVDSALVLSQGPPWQALSGGLISRVDIEDPAGPASAQAWATLVPEKLQHLIIDFQIDTHYIDILLSSIISLGGKRALTALCIRSASTLPPNLVPFLICCSQIRQLSFDVWSLEPKDALALLKPLPSDAIPFLEDFTGPVELSEVFVKGRPVHTVKLMFDIDSPADVLLPLHLSTASVMKLEFVSIYSTEDDPSSFLQHAPLSTHHFSWGDSRSYKDRVMLCLPALSRLKNLRVIAGRVLQPCGIDFQNTYSDRADIVRKFSAACPSIQEFDFRDEKWLARKEGGWERYSSE